jgi:sulfur transfer protein SufE
MKTHYSSDITLVDKVGLLLELSREFQRQRDREGPKPIVFSLGESLACILEQADQAKTPVPACAVDACVGLIVAQAFVQNEGLGADLAFVLSVLKAVTKIAVAEVLSTARAEGLGWLDACAQAKAVADACAVGSFARVGRPT